ncbi:hypothetical protein ACIRQY_02245 [Streptomyces sp. NPDC101490]|uniref:hypothetical protein n=1 Tax=Streptomyces sp. NPDC101490 TaxID=3366143 RepID=UPI00381F0AEC
MFARGRARYPDGGIGFEYGTYVERCRLDGTICEILPGRTLGTSGWTASGGTNYSQTHTPMYYDPSDRKVRACRYHHNTNDPWKRCTGWARHTRRGSGTRLAGPVTARIPPPGAPGRPLSSVRGFS